MSFQVGLLGFGTIGKVIAHSIADGTLDARLSAVSDNHPDAAEETLAELFPDDPPPVVSSLGELTSPTDLVVEAADGTAVSEAAAPVLEAGCDLLAMSVGAFADERIYDRVIAAARESDSTLHVPSGAIAGLDAVKTAAVTGEIRTASLTTTKPPSGLTGAPYVEEEALDLKALDQPTTVFVGTAREAAPAFPSNINVAMALALAGIGPDRTTVRIVADPTEENNVHHIDVEGSMGEIETTVRNVPSPNNPKTSYLAAVSAVETLRGLGNPCRVGT